MTPIGTVHLAFDPFLNRVSNRVALSGGLSAVAQLGNTLWVTNDETASLEQLVCVGRDDEGIWHYGQHRQFAINEFVRLPALADPDDDEEERAKTAEADVEGLAYADGYLWL